MDPLATTSDRDAESEEECNKENSDIDFNLADADSNNVVDTQLARGEEIIVVSYDQP